MRAATERLRAGVIGSIGVRTYNRFSRTLSQYDTYGVIQREVGARLAALFLGKTVFVSISSMSKSGTIESL
jgi:hypothetical protein